MSVKLKTLNLNNMFVMKHVKSHSVRKTPIFYSTFLSSAESDNYKNVEVDPENEDFGPLELADVLTKRAVKRIGHTYGDDILFISLKDAIKESKTTLASFLCRPGRDTNGKFVPRLK